MPRPRLIIVTGRPGAGKTTLAEAISRGWCLPLVSRDRLKEGYVHTQGQGHEALPPDANLLVTQAFFDALGFLIDRGVSLIAEAAFQHPLWEAGLRPLMAKARVTVLICSLDAEGALERFLERGLSDERRGYFHGDRGVQMLRRGIRPEAGPYEAPRLDAQTIRIDTSGGYSPSLDSVRRLIFGQ